jgi:hypothetical protein
VKSVPNACGRGSRLFQFSQGFSQAHGQHANPALGELAFLDFVQVAGVGGAGIHLVFDSIQAGGQQAAMAR